MNRILLIFSLFLSSVILAAPVKRPAREHNVYFANTPNELNVYRLYGRFDGKTVFILGGIQGDEPGGYLSADLYPDLVLEKGNLIIIPRANFHSIILNRRGVNGDMNRRFDRDTPANIDDQIVEIIKGLMAESDIFLNLHDGSGFFSPRYVDQNRNPQKYGQSIIADVATYIHQRDTLRLAEMAEKVLTRVNAKIENPEHHLHFMNTNTLAPDTRYPEQKKSATYYALTTFHIPAFGIETSKDLKDIELKIRYHNYAINEFIKIMGIEPEHPAILYDPPRLIYLLLAINDQEPGIAEANSTVRLQRGDVIRVSHIESNYDRGLSCDVIGLGSEQDFRKPLAVTQPTSIIVRKDNQIIGEIKLQIDGQMVRPSEIVYSIEVNGQLCTIGANETLKVRRQDKIRILSVTVPNLSMGDFKVNLKGYAPPKAVNNGEDRQFLIEVRQLNWSKYAVDRAGKIYPIVIQTGDREIARAFVAIVD